MTRDAEDGNSGRPKFGIPSPGTLLGEHPDARAARIAAVHRLIVEVFELAESHLGAKDARTAWASAVKQMKPGAKRGTRDQSRDDLLLSVYDHAVSFSGMPGDAIPGYLGKLLFNKSFEPHSDWQPQSAEAIEKLIRRLIKRRTKVRSALSDLQPTILTGAGLK